MVLRFRRSSLNERKRTRDTMRAESTSTMSAVEPSLTSWYEPALWLTMTMKTSTLAAAGMGRPSMYLPGLTLPAAWSRRERTLKRASRMAPAHTYRPAMKMPSRPKWLSPHLYIRRAGAAPKVMTSARESRSRPRSVCVLVRRATRPSKVSKSNPKQMASAAR